MLIIHNQKLREFIKNRYFSPDILKISVFLKDRKIFSFPTLDNGLFPAAAVSADTEYIGYANVWLRDNIFLAYSHYVVDESDVAVNNVNSLMAYFKNYQWRFEGIIEGSTNPDNVMKRPHIRFNGVNLEEIDQEWNHAQNDALGYFLWFYCKLAREKLLKPQPDDLKILTLFLFILRKSAIGKTKIVDTGKKTEKSKLPVLES